MKKMVFTLALLLMSLSAVMAQTWDFQEEGFSTTDKANLDADPTNWVYDATGNRYKSQMTVTAEALKANGVALDCTDGLLFTLTKLDAVRVDFKKSCITLNQKSVVTIKNLSQGFIVKVKCQSSNKDVNRSLTASNVTPATTKDFNTTGDKTLVTYTGTVTADGDVTLSNSGGLYIYSISVVDPNKETPDEPGAFHNVSASKIKNQMVLNVGDETKYYNTADVKASINNASGAFTVSSKTGDWSDVYVGKVANVSFVKAQLGSEDGNIDNSDAAKVSIKAAQSWFQSAFVEWLPYEGATTYNVYVKGGQYSDFTKIDYQLVRDYGTYGRADALGLKAGEYQLKVVPVVNDAEVEAAANIATGLNVRAHDRSGFAFNTSKTPGAYNADGTLKSNVQIVYITNANKDNVTLDVNMSGDNKPLTKCTGLQGILTGIKKGKDARPFLFRLIGNIDVPTGDKGDIVIDMNGSETSAGVTIEGVGNDAVANGWGIRLKGARYAEVANIGFMNCSSSEGDNVGLQQDNEYVWVHNCDMFYGGAGSDADQAKGDGALDCKGSNYVTFSYNHFWDNGKCNLLGLSEDRHDLYITYHHNWYDHSDSRHPRIRFYNAHVYNNYYDGNAKYGVGSTNGSCVFVENNYFRNTNRPMSISMQGSDNGTFSKEDGGIIKEYGNAFVDMKKLNFTPYSKNNVDFDAYDASSRDEQVPQTVVSKKGGNKYNNFDTSSSMYSYTADKAEDVPAVVAGQFGAGRVQHGDFQWSFNNSVDDASYDVNADLKKAVTNYKTTLVKIFNGENISTGEGGSTEGGSTGGSTEGGETGGSGSGSGEGGSTGGSTGGTEGGSTVTPIEGTVTCSFTANGKEAVPSNTAFTLTGEAKNVRKEETVIEGTTYTASLKMETNTEVSFTTSQKMTLYVYYGVSGTKTNVKVDGVKQAGAPTTVVLEAGAHKITKGDSSAIALIKLVPVTE